MPSAAFPVGRQLMRAEDDVALERVAAGPPLLNETSLLACDFATSSLPPKDQFIAWRNSFAPILDLAEPADPARGFAGRQLIWDWGNLLFARIKTERLTFASLPRHMRHDPLDHWMLTLLVRGNMETTTPDGTFKAGPGTVQVHRLGKAFTGRVTDCEMLVLFVPPDTCRDIAVALGAAEFSTLDTGMGRLLADYFADVGRRLSILDATDLPGLVSATQAIVRASLSPSTDRVTEADAPIAQALFERARRIVRDRLFERDLGAETLRRELGISRTRLYNLFGPSGGVVRYIQQRRLHDAHSVLADPDDRRLILEVAEERGFNDGAEFSRAFKREFGYSPSEVRKGTKNNRAMPGRATVDLAAFAPWQQLGALLRRL
jgi:AraC-like DNA-binding protein